LLWCHAVLLNSVKKYVKDLQNIIQKIRIDNFQHKKHKNKNT
jgi:hypothetical protein